MQYFISNVAGSNSDKCYKVILQVCRDLFRYTASLEYDTQKCRTMTHPFLGVYLRSDDYKYNIKENVFEKLEFLFQTFTSVRDKLVSLESSRGNLPLQQQYTRLIITDSLLNDIIYKASDAMEMFRFLVETLHVDLTGMHIDLKCCFKSSQLVGYKNDIVGVGLPTVTFNANQTGALLKDHTPGEVVNVGNFIANGTIRSEDLANYCTRSVPLTLRNVIALNMLTRASITPEIATTFGHVMELPP